MKSNYTFYNLLVYLLFLLPSAQLMFTWLNIYIVAGISFAALLSFVLLSCNSHKCLITERYLIIASALLSLLVTLVGYQRVPLILSEPTSFLAAIRHLSVFASIFITITFFSSPQRAACFALALDACLLKISLPLSIYLALQQYRYFMTSVSLNLYQGGTSWLALIPLAYSLYNRRLSLTSRLLAILFSLVSILLASKRSALLSALLVVGVYVISTIIKSANKLFVSLRVEYSFVILSALMAILYLFLVHSNSGIITIFKDLDFSKLSLTLSYLFEPNSNSSTDAITSLTGGRNLEFDSILNYLNTNLHDYILSVLTLGYGIGWFNSSFGDGTSSIHNSLLLLLMIGGLPMLIFEFRLLRSLLSKFYSRIRQPLTTARCISYKSLSPISLALLIDALFSANLVVSPLCMILLLMSLSKKESDFSLLHSH